VIAHSSGKPAGEASKGVPLIRRSRVRYLRFLIVVTGFVVAGAYVARAQNGASKPAAQAPESPLIVKPYVQLGYGPAPPSTGGCSGPCTTPI
jgi:hypothetical protein